MWRRCFNLALQCGRRGLKRTHSNVPDFCDKFTSQCRRDVRSTHQLFRKPGVPLGLRDKRGIARSENLAPKFRMSLLSTAVSPRSTS